MYEVTEEKFTSEQVETIQKLVHDLEEVYVNDTDEVIHKEAKRLMKMGVTSYRAGDMTDGFKEFSVERNTFSDMNVLFKPDGDEIVEVLFRDEKAITCHKLSGDGVIYTMAGSTMLMRRDNTRLEMYNCLPEHSYMSKDDARKVWEFFTILGYEVLEECD
jgi:hypothetical protein